ncbi:MAG: hypothetical protein QOH77_58, partial [Actinomycetota bacterium]|nr:hypothetical protein [Actinomycetota bacterium]
ENVLPMGGIPAIQRTDRFETVPL